MTDVLSQSAAVAVALLVVAVPGSGIAAALRLRGLWHLAAMGPLSIAAIGTTGVVAAWLRIPFGPIPVLVLALVAVLVLRGLAWALARAGRPWTAGLGTWDRETVLSGIAIAVGSLAIAVPAVASLGTLDSVSQTYDGVFHLNATAYVLDTGDASSFHLYRVTHPGDDVEFYPAAWHALTALVSMLTGAGIPVAMNAAWIATASLVWTPGAALLAAVVVRRRAAGAIGAVLASCFALFPLLMLAWGTLYPTGLAYASLPLGLALAAALLSPGAAEPPVGRLALWLMIAAWLAAEAFSHPRSLPSFALLAGPLVLVRLGRLVAAGWRARRGVTIAALAASVVALAGIAAVGWWYVYRTYDVANRPISDHLNGGPATARQSIGEALAQAVLLASRSGFEALPPVLLAALVLLGAVVAVRRRQGWLTASWVVAVVLFALASGSNSDLAKLATGLWYKDQYRLLALVAVVGVPLAALGVHALASRLRRGRDLAAAGLTGAVAVSSWLAPATLVEHGEVRGAFAIAPAGTPGVMLDEDEYRFLEQLDELVPEGAVIAGNPWSGAALTWALAGREPLFPHLTGEWTADELLVASALDRAADDPEVCAAVQRLGIEHVLTDPGMLWGSPVEAEFYAGIDRAAGAPFLEEVARAGDTVLWRVADCESPAAPG